MKERKSQKQKPWLTPTGVAIPTGELAAITTSWDRKTWNAYLKWYERPLKARLLIPRIYEKLVEEQVQSIFQQFGQTISPANRFLCDGLLETLLPEEAQVLKLIFMEGRTQCQIGAILGLSQPRIYQIKNKALQRLKRGPHGDKVITREYMRGEDSEVEGNEKSVWNEKLSHPPKRDRAYRPQDQLREIDSLENSSLRLALQGLSERARTIIYLRHFCELSLQQIARRLSMGVYVVEQIESSATSKIKRNVMQLKTGTCPGEGALC